MRHFSLAASGETPRKTPLATPATKLVTLPEAKPMALISWATLPVGMEVDSDSDLGLAFSPGLGPRLALDAGVLPQVLAACAPSP